MILLTEFDVFLSVPEFRAIGFEELLPALTGMKVKSPEDPSTRLKGMCLVHCLV